MANQWNSLLKGIFEGGSLIGNAIVEKNRRNSLNELYTSATSRLNELINPQPTMQETPMGKFGNIDMPTQNKPDYNTALKELFNTNKQFLEYGDEGKPYANLLNQFFEANQPDYQVSKMGEDYFSYDKKNPNTTIKKIYSGEPDLKPYNDIKPRVEQKGDNYIRKTAFYKNNGEVVFKESPATLQDYERQQAEDVTKSLDWLEKEQVKLENKEAFLQFKLDLGLGGKGKGGYGDKLNLDEIKEDQLKDLLKLEQYNRNFNYLDTKEKENRTELEKRLREQLGLSDDELFNLSKDLAHTTEKGQKNIMSNFGKDKQKFLKNTLKNIQIADNIQAQFNKLKAEVEAGKLSIPDFYATLKNWFEDNKASLPKEIIDQIQKQISQYAQP